MPAVLQLHVLVPVFQQVVQFAEYFRYIPPVQLIDHQDMWSVRIGGRLCRDPQKRPGYQLKPRLAFLDPGTEALDEVLVRIGRVELHNGEVAALVPAVLRDPAGHVRLAGSGWSVEYYLPLFLQIRDNFRDVAFIPKQFLGQRRQLLAGPRIDWLQHLYHRRLLRFGKPFGRGRWRLHGVAVQIRLVPCLQAL